MTEQPLTPPGTQVNAATTTTATTGLALWAVEGFFHGAIPPPVYAFVVLVVPAALGMVGAHLAYRKARRRLDMP